MRRTPPSCTDSDGATEASASARGGEQETEARRTAARRSEERTRATRRPGNRRGAGARAAREGDRGRAEVIEADRLFLCPSSVAQLTLGSTAGCVKQGGPW